MDNNFSSDDIEKISKLNSGGLINLRLNDLWKDAHKHSRLGMYSSWTADLDCIWSELGGEYQSKSEEQIEFNNLNKQLSSIRNWSSNLGFKRMTDSDKLEMARQYIILRQKELFLRRIQNKQGKGTAYSDGSEDDWE